MKNYMKMSLATAITALGFSGCVNQGMVETKDKVGTTMNNGKTIKVDNAINVASLNCQPGKVSFQFSDENNTKLANIYKNKCERKTPPISTVRNIEDLTALNCQPGKSISFKLSKTNVNNTNIAQAYTKRCGGGTVTQKTNNSETGELVLGAIGIIPDNIKYTGTHKKTR